MMLGGISSSDDESIIVGMMSTLVGDGEGTNSKEVQKTKTRRVSANFSDEIIWK
jgi:hypothetical protein